jgi:hypothetical protein
MRQSIIELFDFSLDVMVGPKGPSPIVRLGVEVYNSYENDVGNDVA